MTDIAIAHKDFAVRGGGERLVEELSRTFDAPIYVGRRNAEYEGDDRNEVIEEIDHGPLPDWLATRMIDRGGATRALAYQLAWQQQPALAEADTVITSGNEPLWYQSMDDQTVVAYTHSTPRFQYDLFQDHEYGLLGTAYAMAVRTIYETNVTEPDLYVANSDLVARRIQKYWNIPEDQIRVVYPPVQTHKYSPDAAPTGDFYLYVGRLAEHKRVDDLIREFNFLGDDYTLKIAGRGPDKQRLERLADDHIGFCGYVSETRKQELMAAAKAHVYPALNEDFGMVPVESMAAGTPVIGIDEGFTQFQLLEGKNGYTFERETRSLYHAIRRFETEGVDWDEDRIAQFADRFSVQQFREGMREAVAEAEAQSEVTPPWRESDAIDDETPTARAATDGGDRP